MSSKDDIEVLSGAFKKRVENSVKAAIAASQRFRSPGFYEINEQTTLMCDKLIECAQEVVGCVFDVGFKALNNRGVMCFYEMDSLARSRDIGADRDVLVDIRGMTASGVCLELGPDQADRLLTLAVPSVYLELDLPGSGQEFYMIRIADHEYLEPLGKPSAHVVPVDVDLVVDADKGIDQSALLTFFDATLLRELNLDSGGLGR